MPTLVIGGARSGKSAFAQQLCETKAPRRLYIATGEARDDEMRARILAHQQVRGTGWRTLEAPLALGDAIKAARPDEAILVDCLTLWLSNLMLDERDTEAATNQLIETMRATRQPLFLVSNEVGMGLVPDNALGRRFRDAQGRLNQQLAAHCAHVAFVAAGLPLWLKGGA